MIVWMKVTKDKYQIPLILADSAPELARQCGATINTIRSSASHYKSGRIKYPSYISVDIAESEDD